MLWFAVAIPFAAALLLPLLAARLRGALGWAAASAPLAAGLALVAALPRFDPSADRWLPDVRATVPWVPGLGLHFALRLDGLSTTFALLIVLIGALVTVYAGAYLRDDPRRGRFLAYLAGFSGAMLGLVLSDDLFTLFVFWELTSVTSFLLIGFDHRRPEARAAALQALLVTGAGGLALLAGFVLLQTAAVGAGVPLEYAGRVSTLIGLGPVPAPDLRAQALYAPALLLVLIGAFTKSAQFPFHFWLPGAMAAPTPVSALLHSATMVKAGVFLLARLAPALGGTDLWHSVVTGVGALTMLTGAILAVGQHDLKRILAHTTVSVLGILTMLLGPGTDAALQALTTFLVAHALYKAALFLVAGNIDHATGTRDVTQLGGLARLLPLSATAGLLAALSQAGAPPLFGFLGKELLYAAKTDLESELLLGAAVAANILLTAMALQAGVRPFVGRRHDTPQTPHEAPPAMWLGPLLLSVLGLVIGLLPKWFDATLGSAMATAMAGRPLVLKLALWHGLNPEALAILGLSAVTLLAGYGVYRWLRPRVRAVGGVSRRFSRAGPEALYNRLLDGGLRAAPRLTERVFAQRPRHDLLLLFAALVALLALPFAQGLGAGRLPFEPAPALHELCLAGLALAGAGLAAAARSHLSAIAGLGLTGTCVALLFALYSAPDLALTLFLTETLTVVLFVFVFRRLPQHRARRGPLERGRDALVAALGGAALAGVLLAGAVTPQPTDLWRYFAEKSLPEALGRNVVNVILVDFRALDTLGEITVLVLAGLGVLGLTHVQAREADAAANELRPATPGRGPLPSVILTTAARPILLLLTMFSIFMLLRGHNAPGGGFIGGLLVAAGFVLYMLAAGPGAARRVLRASPTRLAGLGLAVALGSGVAAWLLGRPILTGLWLPVPLPGLGKVGTVLLFDLGVYLVVLGAVLAVLLTLAEQWSEEHA